MDTVSPTVPALPARRWLSAVGVRDAKKGDPEATQ